MKVKIAACLTLCILFASCEGVKLLPPENELVVISGYLQANQSFDGVQINSTISLGSTDTTGPPVRDAVVHLIRDTTCYELVHTGNGKYSSPTNPYTPDCPNCGLVFIPGEAIRLEVFHFNKVAIASTVIPPQPEIQQQDVLNLVAPDEVSGEALALDWNFNEDYWFYVEINLIGMTHEPVGGGDPVVAYKEPIITAPFKARQFVVTWDMLPYYGRYQIFVRAIGREYVELYFTRNQDSRDLNEPVSNVSNGLGIFTATNRDMIEVYVVKQ